MDVFFAPDWLFYIQGFPEMYFEIKAYLFCPAD